MFKSKVIRNRVIAVIEKNIEREQNAFDSEEKNLLARQSKEIEALNAKFANEKDALLEGHVNAILGKLK